jgi:hypothetical protein
MTKSSLLIIYIITLFSIEIKAQYDRFENAAPIGVPSIIEPRQSYGVNSPVIIQQQDAYSQSFQNLHNSIENWKNRTYPDVQKARSLVYQSNDFYNKGIEKYLEGNEFEAIDLLNRSESILHQANSIFYFRDSKIRNDFINTMLCRLYLDSGQVQDVQIAIRKYNSLSKKGKKTASGLCLYATLNRIHQKEKVAEKYYKKSIRKDKKCMWCYAEYITMGNEMGKVELVEKLKSKMNRNMF